MEGSNAPAFELFSSYLNVQSSTDKGLFALDPQLHPSVMAIAIPEALPVQLDTKLPRCRRVRQQRHPYPLESHGNSFMREPISYSSSSECARSDASSSCTSGQESISYIEEKIDTLQIHGRNNTSYQQDLSSFSIRPAKTSHARKTEPGHIKRPPNAFILYRSHCCLLAEEGDHSLAGTPSAAQLRDLGVKDHRHISRIVSHLWKALSPDEKAYWEERGRQAKADHARDNPGYRYKPIYRKRPPCRRKRTNVGEIEQERQNCEQVALAILTKGKRVKTRSQAVSPNDGVSDYSSTSVHGSTVDYVGTHPHFDNAQVREGKKGCREDNASAERVACTPWQAVPYTTSDAVEPLKLHNDLQEWKMQQRIDAEEQQQYINKLLSIPRHRGNGTRDTREDFAVPDSKHSHDSTPSNHSASPIPSSEYQSLNDAKYSFIKGSANYVNSSCKSLFLPQQESHVPTMYALAQQTFNHHHETDIFQEYWNCVDNSRDTKSTQESPESYPATPSPTDSTFDFTVNFTAPRGTVGQSEGVVGQKLVHLGKLDHNRRGLPSYKKREDASDRPSTAEQSYNFTVPHFASVVPCRSYHAENHGHSQFTAPASHSSGNMWSPAPFRRRKSSDKWQSQVLDFEMDDFLAPDGQLFTNQSEEVPSRASTLSSDPCTSDLAHSLERFLENFAPPPLPSGEKQSDDADSIYGRSSSTDSYGTPQTAEAPSHFLHGEQSKPLEDRQYIYTSAQQALKKTKKEKILM